jgi:CDP-diglyceride synthetase
LRVGWGVGGGNGPSLSSAAAAAAAAPSALRETLGSLWQAVYDRSRRKELVPLEALCGLVTLGVMDTAASAVGSVWGRRRLAADTSKTVEGTLGGIVAGIIAYVSLGAWLYGGWRAAALGRYLAPVAAACALSGLLEAATDQIDNGVMPFFCMTAMVALRVLQLGASGA